jgi:hypothetical protein
MENPLHSLGYGILAYFEFIKAIWILCAILLLLNLPLFWMFTDHHIYDDKPMAAMSLGNIGGALTICE